MLGWNDKEYDWDKLFQFELLKEIWGSFGKAHLLLKEEVEKIKENWIIKDNKINQWERQFKDNFGDYGQGNFGSEIDPANNNREMGVPAFTNMNEGDNWGGDYVDDEEIKYDGGKDKDDSLDIKARKDQAMKATEEDLEFEKLLEGIVNKDRMEKETENMNTFDGIVKENDRNIQGNKGNSQEMEEDRSQSKDLDNNEINEQSIKGDENTDNIDNTVNKRTSPLLQSNKAIKPEPKATTSTTMNNNNNQSATEMEKAIFKLKNEMMSKFTSTTELISGLYKKTKSNHTRLEDWDKKVKNTDPILNHINNVKNKMQNEMAKSNLNSKKWFDKLSAEFSDFRAKGAETAKMIDELKSNYKETSWYDLVQTSSDGGNLDLSKAMLLNLESKVFKKFALVDERIKGESNEILKLKNESTSCKATTENIIKKHEALQADVETLKKSVNEGTAKNNQMMTDFKKDFNEINKKISDGLEGTKLIFEQRLVDQISGIREIINEISNKQDYSSPPEWTNLKMSTPDASANLEKKVKQLNKHINEVDASFKQFSNTLPLEDLKLGIKELKFAMEDKIGQADIKELYNIQAAHQDEIGGIKDTLHILGQDQNKIKNELQSFGQGLEMLNAAFTVFKVTNRDNSKDSNPVDISRFIDQSKFWESTRVWNSELERLRREDEGLQRMINDIWERWNTVADWSKVNKIEGNMITLLNEFKTLNNKKYADKIETNKLIKSLETQVRALGDDSKRRENDGENWLIAKRPINGYQCASCEAIIQNWNQSKEYLPWNKYPNREDKAYRMGSGFSHMLQMLSSSAIKKNSSDKNYSSDNEDLIWKGESDTAVIVWNEAGQRKVQE